MNRWLAIVNPRSGGNRNSKRLPELLAVLRRLAAHTVLTRHPGHAAELARDAESCAGVVAVGGDGTLFEILKGIDCSRQRIALIPAGRGNSLARDLGLLHRRNAFDVLHWRQARTIDLMQVHITTCDGARSSYLSASTVAVGYAAAVTQRARKLVSLGRMSYVAAAATTRPTRFSASVQYGDAPSREVQLSGLIANNTRHLANFVGFRNASCSDGRFETIEMNAGYVKQTAHNISALSRTYSYEPHPINQATAFQLHMEAPQNLMLDGEIVPNVVSLQVNMLPAALSCNGPEPQ